MVAIIIIFVIIVAVIAILALRQHNRLKEKAQECAKEAKLFHDKLQILSDPSHFFTDEELRQLKREFAPLLDKVDDLYESRLISEEYLDSIGLKDFLRERKFLNHIQSQNNQQHK